MAYGGRYARDKHEPEDDTARGRRAWDRFLDNHIKLIVAVATILGLVLTYLIVDYIWTGGFFYDEEGDGEGKMVTVAYLYGLSEKNGPITWQDFDGCAYTTMSDSKNEHGVYVMRKYTVADTALTLTVAGYIEGEGYTGRVDYATVFLVGDFEFEFSLITDDDFLAYLEEKGVQPKT